MTDASSKDPVKGVYVLYCSSHISTLQGSCLCLFSQVFLFLSFSQDFSSKCLCSSTLSRRCFCFFMPRYHMNYFRPELKMRPWLLRGCGPNSSGHGPCPWPMSMAHGFLKWHVWKVTKRFLFWTHTVLCLVIFEGIKGEKVRPEDAWILLEVLNKYE